ncbi:MAG: YmdB family metallophosphoesterase, partial [Clostridia bacterium]|nr:YmdB family metallophosphoesterase [Clostridia bacterium]
GKVSAVFGTHTHVPTADEQILPGGTGYITDLGMTGAEQSVLGVKPEKVNDDQMVIIAHDIAQRIESEMEYPGQIKIHVVRESRVMDYAK